MNAGKLIKVKDEVIYKNEAYGSNYNSFPSAVIDGDDNISVTFRQARDMRHVYGITRHVDPTSRAVMIRSQDGGETWNTNASVLYDHFLYGVQDPCLNRLKDGTLLATFFTWEILGPEHAGTIGERDILYYEERWVARPAGLYSIRSWDDGQSWDEPVAVAEEKLSLRGKGVELPDGSIIIAAYKYLPGCEVIIFKSTDRGASWKQISTINHPFGVDEPSLYLTPSGKIMAFIRSSKFNGGDQQRNPLLTCESHDGGNSWSEVTARSICTPSPFEAIRLQSGNVLVTYGYRSQPFGIRSFFLNEECDEWDNIKESILRCDGRDYDIGYTSAVQLKNGDIKIFYYYHEDGIRYIASTTCREQQ